MKKLVSALLVLVLALCVVLPSLAEETQAYGGITGQIHWIGKMYEGDGWMAITDGAKLAAEEMGLDVVFTYPEGGETDLAGQINLVENAINSGAAAVVVAPNDSNALVAVCQQVVDAGIPLVVYDTALSDTSLQECFISYDFYQQGVMAADALNDYFEGADINVAVINATAGNQAHWDRESGFTDTVAEKYPNITILGDVLYCDNDSVTAMNQAIDLASTYPELDAIYACNSMAVEGVAPGIASLDTDIVVVSADSSDAIVQAIKDGTIVFTSTCNAAAIGYLSIVATAKILAGEELTDIEWNNQTFSLDTETMTYDAGLYGITPEVVADESLEYMYYPLAFFDSYQGWDWFAE